MMPEDQSEFYQVASIVDSTLDDFELDSRWFAKFLKWAIRGLEEIKLDVGGPWTDIKTCLLDVTSRRTVILPGDFVDVVKVGAKVGQYCITIDVNDQLINSTRSSGTDFVRLAQNPNGIDFSQYEGYYFLNHDRERLFGYGYGLPCKGQYKIYDNGTTKEILLDWDYQFNQLYIEYITNGFDPCGQTIVHPYLKDYLEKFMEFKWETFNNPNRTEASIQRKGRELAGAEVKVRGRGNPLTPGVVLNITRKHTRLTPKI